MPRNGMGTYTLPSNSWNPAVTGSVIESSASNATMNDLASALTQSLSKDGQTVVTGNIQMGSNKLTGLADGAASTDSIAYGQAAKLAVANTFSANQTINGSVSLSGDLTVTGNVIFTAGTISIGNLTVTSVASVASLNVTGTTNLNIANVSSTASLNTLNVASTAAIAVLSVGSSIVVGAASGGSKGAGTINAVGYYLNGAELTSNVVQTVYSSTGSVATGSSVIACDNSIPQITEGDSYASQSITPHSATNLLRIDGILHYSSNQSRLLTVGVFRTGTADAIASRVVYPTTVNQIGQAVIGPLWVVAGATSALTFSLRAGLDTGGGDITINGIGGAQKLGGSLTSGITITEYTP